MNYKAMISARRREAINLRENRGQYTLATEFEEDADAIETLLAERDAAVDSIPKNCNTCCHWYDGGCVAPLELFGGCDFGIRQAWQWRGPQKQD